MLLSNKDGLYKEMFNIALPVALNNLVMASLSFVDTIMIGQLGDVQIAAVGIGNQLFFLYTLIIFGIGSAGGIFVSQFWGKQELDEIKKTTGLSLSLGLLVAFPFVFFSLLIPEQIVGLFSRDQDVIHLGADYVRFVGISYLFSSVSITMAQVQRSVERALLPFHVSLVSLGLNTILNYLFIFGKLGFPVWGVKGVAFATAISRFIECCLMLLLIYRGKDNPAAGKLRELFDFNVAFLKRFSKTSTPVVLNEFFWALGMTAYKVVFGRMGTSDLASVNISESIINLLFIVLIGSATGASVLTGKKIGQGDLSAARRNGGRFLKMALVEGTVIGLLGLAFCKVLPSLFNVSDEIKHNSTLILIVFSIYLPARAFNTHTIIGIFRGGGDTLYAAIIETAGVWLVGVLLAFITGLVFGFPVYIVYAFIGIEEIIKSILSFARFRSGKWLHDLT